MGSGSSPAKAGSSPFSIFINMKFETINFKKPDSEKESSTPSTYEGQVKTGILLAMSAAAAIAFGCGKEKKPDDILTSKTCVPTMPEETKEEPAPEVTAVEVKEAPPVNQYELNLGGSLNKYLEKISGGAAREEKKQELLGRIERAEKKIWQGRFNASYNGQKAYFGQILENPDHRTRVAALVKKYAAEYGLPEEFGAGVIGAESGGKQFRIDSAGKKRRLGSDKGAVGLMGVTPIAGVEAGIFKRGELFSRDKEGKEFLDPVKSEALTKRLAEDMDLNARVGFATLAYLEKRYHGDLGLAAAAYAGGIVGVENQLLRIYNARLQREYAGKLKAQRAKSKKGFIQPPKLETRISVFQKKGGWAQFIAESGLSIIDLVDDGESYYPADTYPFEVLALGPVVEEILHSPSAKAEITRLVSAETEAKWRQKKLARK